MEAGTDVCLVFVDVKHLAPHQLHMLMEKLWQHKPKPGGYIAVL